MNLELMIRNMFKKINLKIKTFILLCLPLGLYIWILKNFTDTRLTNYSGILGTDPISYIVYNDVVLVDLSKMKI